MAAYPFIQKPAALVVALLALLVLTARASAYTVNYRVTNGNAFASWNLQDTGYPGLEVKLVAYKANGTFLTDMTSWMSVSSIGSVSSFSDLFIGQGASMKLWTRMNGTNEQVADTAPDGESEVNHTWPPPPAPAFSATVTAERSGPFSGWIKVTSIHFAPGDVDCGFPILPMVAGITWGSPTHWSALKDTAGNFKVAVNFASNDSYSATVDLIPATHAASDAARRVRTPLTWGPYVEPAAPPSTAPATAPATQPLNQSATTQPGPNLVDMSGNPVPPTSQPGHGGYSYSNDPATGNGGTSSGGVPSNAPPSQQPTSQPANYAPGGPTPGTGAPLTGGGGIINNAVTPTTAPSNGFPEPGVGGPWDRVRQKLIAWLPPLPSFGTGELHQLSFPIPWLDGSTQNFTLDFDAGAARMVRLFIRNLAAVLFICGTLWQVIKDVRNY